jgi:hypothetical protein
MRTWALNLFALHQFLWRRLSARQLAIAVPVPRNHKDVNTHYCIISLDHFFYDVMPLPAVVV